MADETITTKQRTTTSAPSGADTDEKVRKGEDREGSVRKKGLTKVSANFVPRAVAALEVASEITGDNQTDVLNRSVQVYAYISKMIDEGKLIFVENPATGDRDRLILL